MRKILFLPLFVLSITISCIPGEDPVSSVADEIDDEDIENTTSSTDDVITENDGSHELESDYQWSESDIIDISISNDLSSINNSGISISANTLTITASGIYRLTGTMADGRVLIDTESEDPVIVIFNGIDIYSSENSPFSVMNAEKVIVNLADGTTNTLADSDSYVFDEDDDEPNATLYSKSDLSIFGDGKLVIDANYNDAITSKDGLVIRSGTFDITTVDDGIRGKDYLIIHDAVVIIEADGDGLKSDNDEDSDRGYISIENGTFDITASGDGITAETDLLITGGDFTLVTGGGSSNSYSSSTSMKALKATSQIIIDNGDFVISSADDALHSNANLVLNDGTFTISSGDDGIHADSTIGINGGTITITKSYEGIESRIIVINDGYITSVSSDDGLNVAGGNDGSASNHPGGWGTVSSGDYYLIINGGFISVNASGDGLDANGSIIMTGGTVLVHGPTERNNGALDFDQSFEISGGLLIAAGSSGMLQAPGNSSEQYSAAIYYNSTISGGTLFNVQNADGETLFTFKPAKNYQAVVVSSPDFEGDKTYTFNTGGSISGGTNDGGLYLDGDYTAGSKKKEVKFTSKVMAANGG